MTCQILVQIAFGDSFESDIKLRLSRMLHLTQLNFLLLRNHFGHSCWIFGVIVYFCLILWLWLSFWTFSDGLLKFHGTLLFSDAFIFPYRFISLWLYPATLYFSKTFIFTRWLFAHLYFALLRVTWKGFIRLSSFFRWYLFLVRTDSNLIFWILFIGLILLLRTSFLSVYFRLIFAVFLLSSLWLFFIFLLFFWFF